MERFRRVVGNTVEFRRALGERRQEIDRGVLQGQLPLTLLLVLLAEGLGDLLVVARERLGLVLVLLPLWPRRYARCALFLVFSDVSPFSGGGRSTPARRALERPIAIACSVDRAPCLPSRTCSISSRTNSPA